MRLMPTSITTAPGLTMSAVTNFGWPMADDQDVGLPRDVGQVARAAVADRDRGVGAAPRCTSMMASGLPTMSLRPTTTTCCPAIGDAVADRASAARRAACRAETAAGPARAGRRFRDETHRRP